MLIREMTRDECLAMLAGTRLARLATARENQPYIVPVYLVYDEGSECLYGFTTLGQKIEWMRANPLVCVEMDKVTAYDQWMSVVIFGHFEEVPAASASEDVRSHTQLRRSHVSEAFPTHAPDPEHRVIASEQDRAWQILKNHPGWSESGCAAWAARADRDMAEPFQSIYYRIRINQITGHEAMRDAKNVVNTPSETADRVGWVRRTVTHVFGGGAKDH